LIREIVGAAREPVAQAEHIEVLLPRDVVGLEELRRRPEELGNDRLSQFVKAITGDTLQGEGVTFGVAEDNRGGLRLRFTDQGMVLDYSDEAIAALLLRHLQPRFRALLEGIVK
jgi:V/A-type H+-transporting ATPase subunit E